MKQGLNLLLLFTVITISCSNDRITSEEKNSQEIGTNVTNENVEVVKGSPQNHYKILALGDSYTIGEKVCETCPFPEQLKQSLISKSDSTKTFELKIIARTGWTTTDLLSFIDTKQNLANDYDLVTLLIGVNNQYQGKSFSSYETEFPQLIAKAITSAKLIKENVIVISIPDYAYTPFGKGNRKGNNSISVDIEKYNDFAKSYCRYNNITFVNITDISRMGLENPNLVASDGLHPSELAYSKFVERIVPLALEKLKL
jgi:lysophospholipase L1-like esterase